MIAIEEFAETDSPSEGLRRIASLTRAGEGGGKKRRATKLTRIARNHTGKIHPQQGENPPSAPYRKEYAHKPSLPIQGIP